MCVSPEAQDSTDDAQILFRADTDKINPALARGVLYVSAARVDVQIETPELIRYNGLRLGLRRIAVALVALLVTLGGLFRVSYTRSKASCITRIALSSSPITWLLLCGCGETCSQMWPQDSVISRQPRTC